MWMVRVLGRGLGFYHAYEKPHKDRSTRMCVVVVVGVCVCLHAIVSGWKILSSSG